MATRSERRVLEFVLALAALLLWQGYHLAAAREAAGGAEFLESELLPVTLALVGSDGEPAGPTAALI